MLFCISEDKVWRFVDIKNEVDVGDAMSMKVILLNYSSFWLSMKYDGLLNDHLNPQSANRFYLSSKIQNDFIDSISKEITDTIANEMKGAKFFAIIADSTIDHTKVDEVDDLRYVWKNGQIAERFISFQQLEDSKSETMYYKILSTIQTLGLHIALCRGQAYDGAFSMSGAVSGVQRRIKLDAPNAI